MRKNNSGDRGRGARNKRNSRADSRGSKSDPSRRPKFRKSKKTSSERRAAANSVFSISTRKNGLKKDGAPREDEPQGRRLQQVLAAAGYGSRRNCEELILDGRVDVDGEIVTELGVRVRLDEQKIRVDGEPIHKSRPVYVALNKPRNALCTNFDPSGRRRVVDFIPDRLGRLFPIGRLDQNSEGLILLTNDGALSERLAHPRFEVPKKYRVQVAGEVDGNLARALERGVHIAEGIVQARDVVIKSSHKTSSILEITLTEGKNREIRRMLARVGHKVMRLRRVQIGSIKLGDLAPGEFRLLTSREVADLYGTAEYCARARDDEFQTSRRPLEVSELEEIEARKREGKISRSNSKDDKKGGKEKKADPFFRDETRKQFHRGFEDASEPDEFDSDSFDARRVPNSEFPFEKRKRGRRDYREEERTIGPRKFSRAETSGPRDRFNEDASERRERAAAAFRASKRGSRSGATGPRAGFKSKKRGR